MKDDDDEEDNTFGVTRYPCMPSLVALQQMKNRLHLGFLGRKLMKWTALATGRELRRLAVELHEVYQGFGEDMRNAFILLARSRYFCPQLNQIVTENIGKKAGVIVQQSSRSVSGVKTVQFEILETEYPPYEHLGIGKGGQTILETKKAWLELLRRLIMMMQLRNSFMMVEAANKNATKKWNVLSKVVIPRVKLSCGYIVSELEEIEREDNFRLKRFKELKTKKNKGDKRICLETVSECEDDECDACKISKVASVLSMEKHIQFADENKGKEEIEDKEDSDSCVVCNKPIKTPENTCSCCSCIKKDDDISASKIETKSDLDVCSCSKLPTDNTLGDTKIKQNSDNKVFGFNKVQDTSNPLIKKDSSCKIPSKTTVIKKDGNKSVCSSTQERSLEKNMESEMLKISKVFKKDSDRSICSCHLKADIKKVKSETLPCTEPCKKIPASGGSVATKQSKALKVCKSLSLDHLAKSSCDNTGTVITTFKEIKITPYPSKGKVIREEKQIITIKTESKMGSAPCSPKSSIPVCVGKVTEKESIRSTKTAPSSATSKSVQSCGVSCKDSNTVTQADSESAPATGNVSLISKLISTLSLGMLGSKSTETDNDTNIEHEIDEEKEIGQTNPSCCKIKMVTKSSNSSGQDVKNEIEISPSTMNILKNILLESKKIPTCCQSVQTTSQLCKDTKPKPPSEKKVCSCSSSANKGRSIKSKSVECSDYSTSCKPNISQPKPRKYSCGKSDDEEEHFEHVCKNESNESISSNKESQCSYTKPKPKPVCSCKKKSEEQKTTSLTNVCQKPKCACQVKNIQSEPELKPKPLVCVPPKPVCKCKSKKKNVSPKPSKCDCNKSRSSSERGSSISSVQSRGSRSSNRSFSKGKECKCKSPKPRPHKCEKKPEPKKCQCGPSRSASISSIENLSIGSQTCPKFESATSIKSSGSDYDSCCSQKSRIKPHNCLERDSAKSLGQASCCGSQKSQKFSSPPVPARITPHNCLNKPVESNDTFCSLRSSSSKSNSVSNKCVASSCSCGTKEAGTTTRRTDRYDVRPLKLLTPEAKKPLCICRSDSSVLRIGQRQNVGQSMRKSCSHATPNNPYYF